MRNYSAHIFVFSIYEIDSKHQSRKQTYLYLSYLIWISSIELIENQSVHVTWFTRKKKLAENSQNLTKIYDTSSSRTEMWIQSATSW